MGLDLTVNMWQSHIYKCEKVFCGLNYRKNTMQMALFQNYEVFYIKK